VITPSGLLSRARSTLHPEGFHGEHARGGFFEGWYVKLVSADRSQRWAVIPGVFVAEDGEAEAFVQVLDGSTGASEYVRFDRADFSARSDAFDVRVGPNRFAASGVELDLPQARLRGSVTYTGGLQPWPVSVASPGIMGWYAWMPFMECYHGVVSFDHGLAGTLEHDGTTVDLGGGRGYVEKDWGQAFPAGYVWMQTNHFTRPRVSLTASVALIPWLRSEFRGFIVGLWVDGTLHRFATYTGARSTGLAIDDEHVTWTLRARSGLTLELRAERQRGGLLHAPIRTEMHRRVEETLDARVHVRLSDAAGTVLLDDVGECAGLEVHGDLDRLLATTEKART
jgi:tocopherol cyclase